MRQPAADKTATRARPRLFEKSGWKPIPIAELEHAEVLRAMAKTHGNNMETVRRLGISRRALYRRLEKLASRRNGEKPPQP